MVYVTIVYQLYGMFTWMYVNIKHKNGEYNCLPDDKPMGFETCRRRQKLKKCIKLLMWKVCISLVYVYNYITMHGAKNIKKPYIMLCRKYALSFTYE